MALAQGATGRAVTALALIVLGVVVGIVLLMGVRRRLLGDSEDRGEALSMQTIREMRDRGELTDEEYQRATRAVMRTVERNAASLAEARSALRQENSRDLPGFGNDGNGVIS